MTNGACTFSPPFGTVSMGTIFYHHQVILPGKLHNGIHIRHLSTQMNRDNGFCLRSDCSLCSFRIDTVCLFIHIDNDWNCTSAHDCSSSCLECVCRNKDFISPSDINGSQRNFHRKGTTCHWERKDTALHFR